MNDDVRILKQDEEVTFPEFGKMTFNIRVWFKVGDHGPFTKLFPKEGFTGAAARIELETFAREIRTVNG